MKTLTKSIIYYETVPLVWVIYFCTYVVKIVYKIKKRNIFSVQTGSKLPPVTAPKGYQKFSHSL